MLNRSTNVRRHPQVFSVLSITGCVYLIIFLSTSCILVLGCCVRQCTQVPRNGVFVCGTRRDVLSTHAQTNARKHECAPVRVRTRARAHTHTHGIRARTHTHQDGEPENRPMTVMAPGGVLPDRRAAAYQPPPASLKPPLAPFSSARPSTGSRSCRGYDFL